MIQKIITERGYVLESGHFDGNSDVIYLFDIDRKTILGCFTISDIMTLI